MITGEIQQKVDAVWHIATLRSLGIAERVGSNKTGYWKIKRPIKKGGGQ